MASSDLLLKPPTSLAGVMDEGRYYALSVDFAETVPDVIWPVSNITYSSMRNDAAIAAVLAAISLPIRRATWSVDPTGCNPAVAQMVADDLGLPVLGVDKPTAARTRGVSWPEHIRTALMYLVYGHSAFEMLADTSSGQARLVGLYERVQHTISFIHSTPNGDFGGISQFYHPDKEEAPEITADRMVFYSHAREGSAWHGRSLLRAAFAPWLLKREMQRVLATSSRRFGMGVPTVRALPGSNPSPEQMGAAAGLAESMRAGETAGAAVPPNFVVELQGITGSVPDTLAFIKWLNQEVSKSCLAQFLDLGGSGSSHGSFALGQSFVDLFTLSISAIAQEVADQVTRQAAARIVAWNKGPDEPVPAVVVTDIGTKHEITADALLQLMQAGAITADPALETYVRKAYQLPERSIPWVPPAPPKGAGASGPGLLGDSGTGSSETPVAAAAKPAARPRRRRSASGQLALPIAAADGEPVRAPSDDEQASGTDFGQVQQDHDKAVAGLVAVAGPLLAAIAGSLVAAVTAELAAGALSGALEPAEHTVEALATAIDAAAVKLAGRSAKRAVAEVKSIGLAVTGVTVDDGPLAEQAQVTARLVATGMAQTASRVALLHYGPGVEPGPVTEAVQAALDALVENDKSWVTGSLSSALWAAQHAGRTAAFEALLEAHGDDAAVFIASEVNDLNRCAPCTEADGKRFGSYDEALAMYPTGRNVACLGGDRCRGTLFAVPAGSRT